MCLIFANEIAAHTTMIADRPKHSFRETCRRIFRIFAVALVMLTVGVGLGTLGYRYLIGMPWIDAFLNASMVLAGEGPVVDVSTTAGKIFVSIYSIFSGLVFVAVAVILVTPILKRILQRMHLDDVIEEIFEPENLLKDDPPPLPPKPLGKNRPIRKTKDEHQ